MLHSHVHFYWRIGIIAIKLEIIDDEGIYILRPILNRQYGEGTGRAGQLLLEGFDMVQVDMGISKHMNKFTGLEMTNVGDHTREQGVRRNVEWNSQSQITGALIHDATQLAIGHIELAEHVAGRQRHE